MDCKFSLLGCDAKIARRNRSEHEDLEDHLIVAAVTMKELKEENSRLKEKVKSQESELKYFRATTPVRAAGQIKYLYITNLPPGVNQHKLKCLFGPYGTVSKITMNRQVSANVEYLLEDSAKAALRHSEEKGINLHSVRLSVTPMY